MTRKKSKASDSSISTLTYHVTALQITIYFNKEGDHDHNGVLFALSDNIPLLKYLRALAMVGLPHTPEDREYKPETWYKQAKQRAAEIQVPLPLRPEDARQPHPLVRPLVLRARAGDPVEICLKNEIRDRWIGPHLVGDGYAVKTDDGSHVGENPHSLTPPGEEKTYTWVCNNEGVFPFHDGGNYSGGEDGTNVHGLFGALIVEPQGSIWRDPVTGRRSHVNGEFQQLDGLYLDVLPPGKQGEDILTSDTTLESHPWPSPRPYPNFCQEAHREFVIFFHDEPEFLPPHGHLETSPCEGGHGEEMADGHGGHDDLLPIMPISYRAEPMINRERILWRLLKGGHRLERPVLNEEQHHSSWMFGDPATPILKAYIGDPVRIRLLHAGVKETHVFHLHLYEWHAVPEDRTSPRIDAISISPQTGHTIEPVWGAGNRHQVAGDVIWHCHLYPHFHEGMWGMFRTFETLQDGKLGDRLESDDPVYRNRRLGQYPDGTPIERLFPLPDNVPPRPTSKKPGYPLYIPGKVRQKSPIPPWPHTDKLMPEHFDYRPQPTDLERNAFNNNPVPGELFTRRPFTVGQDKQWDGEPDDPNDLNPQNLHFERNGDRGVSHDVAVELLDIEYNGHGWHDPHGHLFYLVEEGHPAERSDPKEPLFFRALHGQILNLTLDNRLPEVIPGTPFDPPFPPCPKLPWEGECAMHVHMVKFDPICADGASVGWNYLSGPRFGKKMVYRWWLDQEFGTIFFHDHLFANYRQKHGLFGALIVEPIGAKFFHPYANQETISGLQARIQLPAKVGTNTSPSEGSPDMPWFREFCIGIGDFIPMFDRAGNPLNPPDHPGGHGDQGVMALNYRNDPIHERLRNPNNRRESVDPAFWFSSCSPYNRDPFTTLFATFQNDPIWIRLVQGSHEEQHSFQIHGMRWRRFRANLDSSLRNQQTIGIAEAFTFINQETYKPGDYLYKLSGADDLWLGCWGIIRAFSSENCPWEYGGLLPLAAPEEEKNLGSECLVTKDKSQVACDNLTLAPETQLPKDAKFRHFHLVAEPRRLVYREPDLVDPYGLIYRLISIKDQDGNEYPVHSSNQKAQEGNDPVHSSNQPEPLILRCREGEWVKVTLENCLPKHLEPEPFAPEVPVEEQNPFSFRPDRPVSSQVSMHADLLRYEVRYDDGANVGKNMRQTIKPGESRTYTWQASRPAGFNAGEPLGPVLLQDMADFRNHRHHGLIGALIVESEDATPLWVQEGETTAHEDAKEAWCGSRVTVVQKLQKSSLEEPHPEEQSLSGETQEERFEEIVLLLQDGIRLFIGGNPLLPVPDAPPGNGEDDLDHEDQGQKAFNYRTEPVGPRVAPAFAPNGSDPPTDWLANPNPTTPTWLVPEGRKVRFHLVGACDKPRNHSFTIHGVTWPEWRFLSRNKQHRVASESAISSGTVRTFEFTPEHSGDHAYRSGVLKWSVSQGLWGILRVLST